MKAKTFFLVAPLALALIGCGGGPSIAGTWTGSHLGKTVSLIAKPDSSFTTTEMGDFAGRWEVDGSEVKLFKDIKNGGDVSFGPGSDGAFHLQLDSDGKSMSGKLGDGSTITLDKK